jgi:hypothetical protein
VLGGASHKLLPLAPATLHLLLMLLQQGACCCLSLAHGVCQPGGTRRLWSVRWDHVTGVSCSCSPAEASIVKGIVVLEVVPGGSVAGQKYASGAQGWLLRQLACAHECVANHNVLLLLLLLLDASQPTQVNPCAASVPWGLCCC